MSVAPVHKSAEVPGDWHATGYARRLWAWNAGLADKLTPPQRILLLALADAADNRGTLRWSVEGVIHVSGLASRTARRALDALQTAGYISRAPLQMTGKSRRQRFETTLCIKGRMEPVARAQSERIELAWLTGRASKLSPRDVLVFVAISSFCCDWKSGVSNVTDVALAQCSGVCVRGIKASGGALDHLTKAGLLRRSGTNRRRWIRVFALPKNVEAEARKLRKLHKSTAANFSTGSLTRARSAYSIGAGLSPNGAGLSPNGAGSAYELLYEPNLESRARARPSKKGPLALETNAQPPAPVPQPAVSNRDFAACIAGIFATSAAAKKEGLAKNSLKLRTLKTTQTSSNTNSNGRDQTNDKYCSHMAVYRASKPDRLAG